MKTIEGIRIPKEQKELFELAANIGGFKTLSDFMIFSALQQASLIVEKHNSILASKKDQEIFFGAIMNPAQPNTALKKAASRYKKLLFGK